MNYGQARKFIEEIGKSGSVYGLESIKSLMRHLGNIQEPLRVIHVAGTNGKGSVCACISKILQAAGFRTGTYLSPAVFSYRESFQVNGMPISRELFAELAGTVRAACVQMLKEGLPHPTAFEVETAVAFCYFQRENCDYVVLETGMGGAEDATNLVTHPVCSVFTSISRDHTAFLGSTLAEIAQAKSGIIKPGCPCVTSVQEPEVMEVIQKTAASKNCSVWTADDTVLGQYEYDALESRFVLDGAQVHCALTGAFQKQNIACALAVVRLLRELQVQISRGAVIEGLEQVFMPGRFERIHEKPDVYIDGAHNEAAAQFLKETVQNCFTNRKIVYIIGVLADKEYEKVLEAMLPYAAKAYTVTPDNRRALDGQKLARKAGRYHPAVSYVPDINEALKQAVQAAGTGGVVLAFGSFSYLRALRQAVKDEL